MPYAKVPLTPAKEAATTALGAVRAAIYSNKSSEILHQLLEVAIATAEIAAKEDPPFYSYWDLTKRWNVSRKTVESWEIPEHKFGRTIRFKREDVLEWERERTQS